MDKRTNRQKTTFYILLPDHVPRTLKIGERRIDQGLPSPGHTTFRHSRGLPVSTTNTFVKRTPEAVVCGLQIQEPNQQTGSFLLQKYIVQRYTALLGCVGQNGQNRETKPISLSL